MDERELPQPSTSAKPLALPGLKTAPTKAALLNTSDETPKPVRRLLALIRVLLASYKDVARHLPDCRLLAKDGNLYMKVSWQSADLAFDADGDLTIVFKEPPVVEKTTGE